MPAAFKYNHVKLYKRQTTQAVGAGKLLVGAVLISSFNLINQNYPCFSSEKTAGERASVNTASAQGLPLYKTRFNASWSAVSVRGLPSAAEAAEFNTGTHWRRACLCTFPGFLKK